MPSLQALADLAWDSASSVTIFFGTTQIVCTEAQLPDVEIKSEKLHEIGLMLPERRTVGRAEISDFTLKMELSRYSTVILPRMPEHGGTLIEFVVNATIKHPSITGSFGVFLDHCRIIKASGIKLSADEKALVRELTISTMGVFEKGADGKPKSLYVNSKKPSSQLQAAMSF
ncbi:MAG: hypothetical protein ACM3O6_02925 [Acidobacteriota bacterium]